MYCADRKHASFHRLSLGWGTTSDVPTAIAALTLRLRTRDHEAIEASGARFCADPCLFFSARSRGEPRARRRPERGKAWKGSCMIAMRTEPLPATAKGGGEGKRQAQSAQQQHPEQTCRETDGVGQLNTCYKRAAMRVLQRSTPPG